MPALRPHDTALTCVRHAESSDLPAVLTVGREAWRAAFVPLLGVSRVEAGLRRAWAPQVLAAEIRAGWVLVAKVGDQIVGMASARPEGEQTFLSRLYVHPSGQSRGIGRLLLVAVLQNARGPVALTVLSTNTRARSFYERQGFKHEGHQPDPDGGPVHFRLVWVPA